MRSLECPEGQKSHHPITALAGPAACSIDTAWVRARFTAETVGGVTVYDLTRTR